MKGSKVVLIIAGILMSAGLCLTIIGGVMGGGRQVVQWTLNGDLSFGPFDLGDLRINVADIEWAEDQEKYSGSVDKTKLSGAENIQNMEIEVGGALVRMEPSMDGEFYFGSERASKYQCYVRGETLYLKSEGEFRIGRGSSEIVLYVPQDVAYQDILIELGAGTVELEGTVQAKSLHVEVGAGEMNADTVDVDMLEIEVGAGAVQLDDVQAQSAELEVGMGQLIFEGNVVGNMSAECAMGSMEFVIENSEEAHNYDLSCSMGSIEVGGNSYSGMAKEQYINNGAKSVYELECSMGEILVKFR